MAESIHIDLPERKETIQSKRNRGNDEEQQQQHPSFEFYSSESLSSDDFTVDSDEDGYSQNSSAGSLMVEIINEGNNNKERIQFLPKSNMRRFNSSAVLNQQKVTGVLNQEDNIKRVKSAPLLLPSNQSIPAFLANRIRKAEIVGLDTSNVDTDKISLQTTTMQPFEGPATKAFETEDPRVLYSQILEKHGICSSLKKGEELHDFFVEMGEANVTGYTMEKISAMRKEDVEALRDMHKKGETLQVCNRFGESIIHSACRRGLPSVVRFLVEEAGVSFAVKDDYGKTPAHDACWTIKPNFEVVKIVITACPDLFLVADKRGSSPLDYAQKSLWSEWCVFLRNNEDMLIPKQLGKELNVTVGREQGT
jgi:hypothetical protein